MGKNEETEMRNLLERSGWRKVTGEWRWAEYNDTQGQSARAESRRLGKQEGLVAGRVEVAALVLKAFDLTSSYPDTTEERSGTREVSSWGLTRGPAFYEPCKYTVTTPGTAVLLEDLKAVAESRDVAEAKKRLGRK